MLNCGLAAFASISAARGTIAAGRRVSSHLVALRPSELGSISFNTLILAILTTDDEFAETNDFLGRIDLDYAPLNALTPASGTMLRYDAAASPDDLIVVRVISAAVPEPGTWAMLIAGFGLVGAQMRRRRSHAAAA